MTGQGVSVPRFCWCLAAPLGGPGAVLWFGGPLWAAMLLFVAVVVVLVEGDRVCLQLLRLEQQSWRLESRVRRGQREKEGEA